MPDRIELAVAFENLFRERFNWFNHKGAVADACTVAESYAEKVCGEVLEVSIDHGWPLGRCVRCGVTFDQPQWKDAAAAHVAHVLAAWKRTKAGGGGTK